MIVNALLPFRVNILRHRPLSRIDFFITKYGNMLESNQSLKLLILLLLCQPCRYEYYSIIDYCHFAIFCFLYITFISTFASLLSNRKCQHICFCLESFLWTIEYFSFTATVIFTTRLLNSLCQFQQVFLNHNLILLIPTCVL